jgi:uncharacterized protein YycO
MNIDTIKKPAILLFHGKGLISSLIRWQTRGKYSHAAFLLPSGEILESWQGDGVRVKTLKNWDGIDIFHVAGISDDDWEYIIQYAKQQVGKKYDYRAIVRFITRKKLESNDRWFCSELVFESLSQAGIKLLDRIDSSEVSPSTLAISPLLTQYNV